jgi:hypothetical protein
MDGRKAVRKDELVRLIYASGESQDERKGSGQVIGYSVFHFLLQLRD